MMPCGPRCYAGATARIAVPKALPVHLRANMRELAGVASVNRGQGEADTLLANVCGEADRTATAMFLHVDPAPGINATRLAAWYSAHGFAVLQDAPMLMMRMPA